MRPKPVVPKSGQESVWDYPRPPRVEPTAKLIQVVFNGKRIAETRRARRVLETAGAPVYYIPPEDVRMDLLQETGKRTFCEWKGWASYFDISADGENAYQAAWTYRQPTAGYEEIRDHVAFYAQKMDACFVEGEKARPQPGRFYGGWITDDVVGPFKGEPGSEFW